MGSSARSRDSDSEKLLFNLTSDAAASEWSISMETSVSPANYRETDACLHLETDEMQELMKALTRRSSFKVAKGLTRMPSSKLRRPGTRKALGGAEQKKKLKTRRKWSSNYDQPSSPPKEIDASPNYLKATRSSDVRTMSSQSSLHESKSSISSRPLIAFRRSATLRPMRKLAKMPSLKPKRPATRKCSQISSVSDLSVHRATCSSSIKDSKFPAQVENQQEGDVSEKISAMKVCRYSYCSLHGHRHSAPTLKRLKSARKRLKSQRSKKLNDLVRNEGKEFGRVISHEAEVVKELNEEINSRKDMDLNADGGGDRVEDVAQVPLQELKMRSQAPMVADEESIHQASDSYPEDQHCLEPSPTSQEAHIKRESEEEILEYLNGEKNEKDESEESRGSEKGKFVSVGVQTEKFVSVGVQTDPELEELESEISAADHIARDLREVSETARTEIEDEKHPLAGDLSHENSTPHDEQSNSSETVDIGEEEEQARAIGTEELASAHEKTEENLESPGEPNESLSDSREETILACEKMDESQESLGEPTEAFSGSSGESNLPCKNMDENLESPRESELDSTGNDSFKSLFGRRKFNGLWYLIYQNMVSDLAENGGIESPVDRDSKEEQVINANMLPESDGALKVANDCEATKQEGIQQSDAIKLLQEAITKILEQSQDQSSVRKPTADNVNFNKKETVEDHSTDCKSEGEPEIKEETLEAHLGPKMVAQRGVNVGGRPNQLASKRWSNLKKYILMKRFIKAMEKTKNFSRRIQRYPSSEVSPEHEKVNLRRQLIGERKGAEEWMLDHALQKAISNLDPAQKRRVALLVEAFESVNPIPGGKTHLSTNASYPSTINPKAFRKTSSVQTEEQAATGNVSYHKLHIGQLPSSSDECIKVRENLCGPSEYTDGDQKQTDQFVASSNEHPFRPIFAGGQPSVSNKPLLSQLAMDKINTETMDQAEGPAEGRGQENQRAEIRSSNSQLGSGNDGANRKSFVDTDIPRMQVPEYYVEPTAGEVSTSSSRVHHEVNNPTSASNALDSDVKSMTTEELTKAVEVDSKAAVEKGEILGSSLPEQYRPVSVTDVGDELQLEKKKYTGLWYLIYKHMASGLATEQGSEPTDPLVDGSKKAAEEAKNEVDKKGRSVDIDSADSLESEQNMLMGQRTDSEEMKLHKIEAVKLVQQAIDDILRECEDSSPHNQYGTGNGVPEQENKEKSCGSCGETSIPASTDSIKDNYMCFGRVKEHKPLLDPEKQIGSGDAAQQNEERMALQGANKSNPRPMKNWSNLRKVILLKRFVKALETKVSNFKPQERRHLPLDPDMEHMEPEKVNLKHQDMDERKNAEEYLLDYALQQVVSRLTPARQRKVHLLVEAFETVTPPLRN